MKSFIDRAISWRDASVGPPSELLDAIGRMLLQARVGCRLDQRSVGEEVSITTSTIGKIERAEVLPNPATLTSLIRFYENRGVIFFPVECAVSLPEPLRKTIASMSEGSVSNGG